MSKTTKIIAALGVVAGLGVAALPAFTYAANPASVNGNADVLVEIEPAIAMAIAGNQDGVTGSGYNNVKVKSDNIATIAGQSVSDYDVTTATTTSGSKVTMLPMSIVDGGIAGATGAATFMSTISVYTNANNYSLTLVDADDNNALRNMDGSTMVDSIPAGTIGQGDSTFTLEAGTNASWGYIVGTPASNHAGYKPVPVTNADTIKSSSETKRQDTVVYYGVSTRADQATGIYSDTVTYTATTAN